MRNGLLVYASAIAMVLIPGCSKSSPTGGKTQDITPIAGMVGIAGGTFQMGQPNPDIGGADASADEQPAHTVKVSSFYMDTTEVTQGDYQTLMGVNPSSFTGDARRPVENVTWFDAVLYCNARSKRDGKDTVYSFTSISGVAGNGVYDLSGLAVDTSKHGYRLPTESEWEYACRAGSSTDYYWGRSYPPLTTADTAAINANVVWNINSSNGTQPVATKKPNAWGLYDMSGNVLEWCNDWYGSYSASSQTNPAGPMSGAYRVLRGGAWNVGFAFLLCTACRNNSDPEDGTNAYGFRVVCSIR
jgi:formylglycine-generating enzyme required for sulfatase activity